MTRETSNETIDAILNAAAEQFAEKGFEGARVDEIAQSAKVNKATLYYQIGDKKALYELMITRVIKQMTDEVAKRTAAPSRYSDKLRSFIETIALHAGIASRFAPIMMREIADGGRNLPDQAIQEMSRLLTLLGTILDQGHLSGEFRQVNARITHMLIISSLMVCNTNEPIRKRMAEMNQGKANSGHFIATNEVIGQIVDLILASVRK